MINIIFTIFWYNVNVSQHRVKFEEINQNVHDVQTVARAYLEFNALRSESKR